MGSGDDPRRSDSLPTGKTDTLIHRLYMVTWAVGSEW